MNRVFAVALVGDGEAVVAPLWSAVLEEDVLAALDLDGLVFNLPVSEIRAAADGADHNKSGYGEK